MIQACGGAAGPRAGDITQKDSQPGFRLYQQMKTVIGSAGGLICNRFLAGEHVDLYFQLSRNDYIFITAKAHFMLSKKILSFVTLISIAVACYSQSGLSTRGKSQTEPVDANAPDPTCRRRYFRHVAGFPQKVNFFRSIWRRTPLPDASRTWATPITTMVFSQDQFFARADIRGHDISFTTRPAAWRNGIAYEFKGKLLIRAQPKARPTMDITFCAAPSKSSARILTRPSANGHRSSKVLKLLAQPNAAR